MKTLYFLLIFPLFLMANNEDLVKNKKKYQFDPFESLRIDISAGQSNLSSITNTNNSYNVKSTKMILVDLRYVHHWSVRNRSYLGAGFTDLTYKKNTSIFENDISNIKIGHTYNPFYKLSISAEVFYLSYFGLDTSFNFLKENSLGARGEIKFDIYHKYETRVGISGGFSGLKNAAYLYDLSLHYRKVYRTYSIEINLQNQQGLIQNTEFIRTQVNNNLIGTKISIPFR